MQKGRDITKTNYPIPKEAQEQEALFSWADIVMHQYPELELLYHIPNEGKRSKSNGAALKRQGLKKGVPDLCLPVARGGYHGLYIEMKRIGEKPSDNQKRWLYLLKQQGYCTTVCDEGWEQAVKVIEGYMKQRDKICSWCQKPNGKTDLDFSVVDDNFGQFVHVNSINYCPFCGRDLRSDNNAE